MEVPVCQDGEIVGKVQIKREGGWAELVMTCQLKTDGLYRGFLSCDGGQLPLGIMAPEGGGLRTVRRIPAAQLQEYGSIFCGFCRIAYAFQKERNEKRPEREERREHTRKQEMRKDPDDGWQKAPSSFFQGDFSKNLQTAYHALWKSDGEGRLLALPWDCGRPFPFIDLFCFVRLEKIRGSLWAVLAFDGDERPQMPA